MAETIDNKLKQPSQQKSTGFTNIQNIVRANRSNRLGQAVSSGVGNVVGKSQQDLSKAREQFQQGAQAGQIGTAADQAYAQQTIQGAGQSGANPAQADIDRFAKLRAGQYEGPQQLANQEQLMAQGADIKSLGQAASGEYGRRGLLQRFVAPDQYTQGQQRLDTLLLGQTGGQALNQARRQANLYGQQLGQAQQSAQAQAQGLQQQAQQFGQGLQKQLGEAQTGLEQDITGRVKTETEQAEAARQALLALWSKPTQPAPGGVSTMPVGGLRAGITQEQFDRANPFLERTGLSDDLALGLGNLVSSPEQLVGQGIIGPTRETIATEADKNRSLALAKLAGVQPSLFTEQTQVGGYDPLGFLNKELYQQKLGESQAKYTEGTEAEKKSKLIQQALGRAKLVEDQLGEDAVKQAEYQRQLGAFQRGETSVAPTLGIDTQGRLGWQQQVYNQANDLLRQAGLGEEVNYYAPPGSSEWQNYQAQAMRDLLTGVTDPRNIAQQQAQAKKGSELQKDYARIPLLERLKEMISGS